MSVSTNADESTISPGLSIIHANHMEDLRDVAIEWIKKHPLSPLENETFIVQSNGMAQWLKLAMASNKGCGISAAVKMQLPARFIWEAYRTVLGEDQIPDQSPIDKDQLVWRLLRLLPALTGKKWFAPLEQYLVDDVDDRKCYQLASYLADLYDQYQVYRADWLHDWISGVDQLRDGRGKRIELPPEQRWQVKLWRHIHDDIPESQRGSGRFRLHQQFLTVIKNSSSLPSTLPRRVVVFGISSLPKQSLEAIHAVSHQSQVLMFVHNPCRYFWADIIEDRDLLRIHNARHRRKNPFTENPPLLSSNLHTHPLLAAWGKQGRDYIGLLYGYDQPDEYRAQFNEIDLFRDIVSSDQPDSLLHQVQQAVLDLTPLPDNEEPKQQIGREDRTILFQKCHSRQREVEILLDHLLWFFERSPDLTPRDVVVMAPDISAYSPHIEAVFGHLSNHDPRHIPYSIADHPRQAGMPIIQALEKLFYLPSSRVTAGDVMDLLAVPAFRERFKVKASDLPQLDQWLHGAGIRWGLHSEHRKSFDLPDNIDQNTWQFGLRRMLLGYAVGKGDAWKDIEPYDEIGGLDAALIGPLWEILEKLETYWRRLNRPAVPDVWVQRLVGLVNDFIAPTNNNDQMIISRIMDSLDQWISDCTEAGYTAPLPLSVIRAALLGKIKETGVSQRLLAGRVNFCTLMPMRAIPFKVVCLLGMNDGEYPRSFPPLDFDLMSFPGWHRPGDRSRREDDRYLFLEALLSAREQFYLSYIGQSARDNSERMPSVLVNQLRDYLAAGWEVRSPDQSMKSSKNRLLHQLTCQHALQPFSRSYFEPKRGPHRFTYAHEWESLYDQPIETGKRNPLEPAKIHGNLRIDQLTGFLKNPIKAFFTQRLNVYMNVPASTTENLEPFSLDSLAPFDLGMQLLDAGLSTSAKHRSDAVFQAADRLRHAGRLPLFSMGLLSVEELADPVLKMLEHHDNLLQTWAEETETIEIRAPFSLTDFPCEAVEDWVDGLRKNSFHQIDTIGSISYARWKFYPLKILDAKGNLSRFPPFITLWVEHLFTCAQEVNLTTYLVAPDGIAKMQVVEPPIAEELLNEILLIWNQGLERPLPVTAKSAMAYLSAASSAASEEDLVKAYNAACKAYEGDGYNFAGELGYGDGIYLSRCFPDFHSLWKADDNAFVTLAETLYAPLMNAVSTIT